MMFNLSIDNYSIEDLVLAFLGKEEIKITAEQKPQTSTY